MDSLGGGGVSPLLSSFLDKLHSIHSSFLLSLHQDCSHSLVCFAKRLKNKNHSRAESDRDNNTLSDWTGVIVTQLGWEHRGSICLENSKDFLNGPIRQCDQQDQTECSDRCRQERFDEKTKHSDLLKKTFGFNVTSVNLIGWLPTPSDWTVIS